MADIERGTNPESFRFRAPVSDTEGNPVNGPLTYNLYRGDSDTAVDLEQEVYLVLPPDIAVVEEDPVNGDIYEVPLPDFVEGRHVIALTAVDADGDESVKSNTLGFRIGVAPEAPVFLDS